MKVPCGTNNRVFFSHTPKFNPILDRYTRRGIAAATYNDPLSESVLTESIVLVVLAVVFQSILFIRCHIAAYRVNAEKYGSCCKK
jgi:hypothetical protein